MDPDLSITCHLKLSAAIQCNYMNSDENKNKKTIIDYYCLIFLRFVMFQIIFKFDTSSIPQKWHFKKTLKASDLKCHISDFR